MAAIAPGYLGRSDVNEAVRYISGRVRAPAIGQLLNAAECVDPMPGAGKKWRIRQAINATQRRDGHGGAIVRLLELVADAEEAERRRSDALRAAYTANAPCVPSATIATDGGFRLEIGTTYAITTLGLGPCVSLRVLPDLEGTLIVLDLDQARDFIREFIEAGREVARRRGELPH